MELRVAGVTFATLLSHVIQKNRDVEGLLFGNVVRTSKQVLVDDTTGAQNAPTTLTTQQYVLRHFYITGFSGSFYDGLARVDFEKLLRIARDAEQTGLKLIGWFRSRRRAPLRLMHREAMVWRELLSAGPRHNRFDIFAVDPVCALFCVNPQSHTTAVTFDYRFIDPGVGGIDAMMCNMGSSSTKEYAELRVMWANMPGLPADVYMPAVVPSGTIQTLEAAHKRALENMLDLARNAQRTQQQCVELEEEIAALKQRILAAHEAQKNDA